MSEKEELPLSEQDVLLLTDARDRRWNLEQYEYACDWTIRDISNKRIYIPLVTGIAGVVLIGLRVAVPDKYVELQWVFSIFGILSWGITASSQFVYALCKWDLRCKGLKEQSKAARDLIVENEKLSNARPLNHQKIKKWIRDALAFQEDTKDPIIAIHDSVMCRGYHHVGKLHNRYGVKCSACTKDWKPEYANVRLSSWYKSKTKCNHCGVKL